MNPVNRRRSFFFLGVTGPEVLGIFKASRASAARNCSADASTASSSSHRPARIDAVVLTRSVPDVAAQPQDLLDTLEQLSRLEGVPWPP